MKIKTILVYLLIFSSTTKCMYDESSEDDSIEMDVIVNYANNEDIMNGPSLKKNIKKILMIGSEINCKQYILELKNLKYEIKLKSSFEGLFKIYKLTRSNEESTSLWLLSPDWFFTINTESQTLKPMLYSLLKSFLKESSTPIFLVNKITSDNFKRMVIWQEVIRTIDEKLTLTVLRVGPQKK